MIEVEDLTISAGPFRLEHLTFGVSQGQYAVVMGKTGSGKTTLLEAICGLRTVHGGRIRLQGRDVTHARPAERGIGYVPQDRVLFPSMTVRQHLALAPRVRGWDRARLGRRVGEVASWLGLEKLLDRRPAGLSGGEAQRVALGRALAAEPSILLLDEPLSALDDAMHQEIADLLAALRASQRVTVLHVTHNRREARRLGGSLFELDGGILRERSQTPNPEASDEPTHDRRRD
jgi:molybdate/tungstate transport system ATP-binding protein